VLATEGLVVLFPNRGARVPSSPGKDMADLFQVMGALEGRRRVGLPPRSPTKRSTRSARATTRCWRTTRAAIATRTYFAANQAIHEAIIAAADNSVLTLMYESLRGRIRPARFWPTSRVERWGPGSARARRDPRGALAARDGLRLRGLLQEHLRHKYEALIASATRARGPAANSPLRHWCPDAPAAAYQIAEVYAWRGEKGRCSRMAGAGPRAQLGTQLCAASHALPARPRSTAPRSAMRFGVLVLDDLERSAAEEDAQRRLVPRRPPSKMAGPVASGLPRVRRMAPKISASRHGCRRRKASFERLQGRGAVPIGLVARRLNERDLDAKLLHFAGDDWLKPPAPTWMRGRAQASGRLAPADRRDQ